MAVCLLPVRQDQQSSFAQNAVQVKSEREALSIEPCTRQSLVLLAPNSTSVDGGPRRDASACVCALLQSVCFPSHTGPFR